jgi:Tol biopolymer transport system component
VQADTFNSPREGKKIAFITVRNTNFEICVINADGSEQENLTNNSDWGSAPSWSPFLPSE